MELSLHLEVPMHHHLLLQRLDHFPPGDSDHAQSSNQSTKHRSCGKENVVRQWHSRRYVPFRNGKPRNIVRRSNSRDLVCMTRPVDTHTSPNGKYINQSRAPVTALMEKIIAVKSAGSSIETGRQCSQVGMGDLEINGTTMVSRERIPTELSLSCSWATATTYQRRLS